jgi:hypothetical protein
VRKNAKCRDRASNSIHVDVQANGLRKLAGGTLQSLKVQPASLRRPFAGLAVPHRDFKMSLNELPMSTLSEEEKADLVAYLDGELDEEASAALEAKLARDPEARAEADALKHAWGLLDYLPKAQPSPNFTNRTLEKLSLERKTATASASRPVAPPARRSRWKVGVAWAAAVLVAGGAGLGASFYVWPVPHDNGPDPDEAIVRHLRILEKSRWYDAVDDLDFLRQLDHPDLFGDETTGGGL